MGISLRQKAVNRIEYWEKLHKVAMSTPDTVSLHQFLIRRYDFEGLKTLCLYLAVDPDNLDGRTKDALARELVRLMERIGRLEELAILQAQEDLAKAPAKEVGEKPLTTPDKRQVFISHAHQDTDFAHRLAADLESTGYSIWIAPRCIPPGDPWLTAISRGLQTSGTCVVVLTPAGVASRWVEYEIDLAISLERKGLMNLVLLDVEDCALPFKWQNYQRLSFRSYLAGRAVLRALLAERMGEMAESDGASVEDGDRKKVQPLSTTWKSAPITQPPVRVENSSRRIHKKTGIEFVYVPAGPFLFGADKTRIKLQEYWIGRFPVTNAQYKRFVDESMYPAPARWDGQTPPSEILDHPVVNVSWYDANAYCSWAGLQLPSEPQWEKAARGVDRRVWPWGNKHGDGLANLFRGWGPGFGTTPVGKFSPQGDSPFECSDMVGNVWEWTNSKAQNLSDIAKAWPDLAEVKRLFVLWYYRRGQHILRGGSYLQERDVLPLLYRYVQNRDWRNDAVGFRVVELLSDPGS